MPGVAKALADQTDIALRLARARLADLSDEEFRWEPVAGCWSLRRKSAMEFVPPDASPGDWWIDGFSDDQLGGEVSAWGDNVARAFLVSHVVAEVLHHSAEVGRLRDLHRNRHMLIA